ARSTRSRIVNRSPSASKSADSLVLAQENVPCVAKCQWLDLVRETRTACRRASFAPQKVGRGASKKMTATAPPGSVKLRSPVGLMMAVTAGGVADAVVRRSEVAAAVKLGAVEMV